MNLSLAIKSKNISELILNHVMIIIPTTFLECSENDTLEERHSEVDEPWFTYDHALVNVKLYYFPSMTN